MEPDGSLDPVKGFRKNPVWSLSEAESRDVTAFIAPLLTPMAWAGCCSTSTICPKCDSYVAAKTSIQLRDSRNQIGGFYPPLLFSTFVSFPRHAGSPVGNGWDVSITLRLRQDRRTSTGWFRDHDAALTEKDAVPAVDTQTARRSRRRWCRNWMGWTSCIAFQLRRPISGHAQASRTTRNSRHHLKTGMDMPASQCSHDAGPAARGD